MEGRVTDPRSIPHKRKCLENYNSIWRYLRRTRSNIRFPHAMARYWGISEQTTPIPLAGDQGLGFSPENLKTPWLTGRMGNVRLQAGRGGQPVSRPS